MHGAITPGGLHFEINHHGIPGDAPTKTVGSYWPYATTVFNYIRRSMPYTAPMSLTNEDYYALTAFILNMNDVIAVDTVIDGESLPGIRMPNRDGFINAYPRIPQAYDFKQD